MMRFIVYIPILPECIPWEFTDLMCAKQFKDCLVKQGVIAKLKY